MNKLPCGQCKKYYEMKKPKRSKKGGNISLHKGHCLAYTIYASNKPGNEVFPPGAIIKELPYGQHIIKIVREKEIKSYCLYVEEK